MIRLLVHPQPSGEPGRPCTWGPGYWNIVRYAASKSSKPPRTGARLCAAASSSQGMREERADQGRPGTPARATPRVGSRLDRVGTGYVSLKSLYHVLREGGTMATVMREEIKVGQRTIRFGAEVRSRRIGTRGVQSRSSRRFEGRRWTWPMTYAYEEMITACSRVSWSMAEVLAPTSVLARCLSSPRVVHQFDNVGDVDLPACDRHPRRPVHDSSRGRTSSALRRRSAGSRRAGRGYAVTRATPSSAQGQRLGGLNCSRRACLWARPAAW